MTRLQNSYQVRALELTSFQPFLMNITGYFDTVHVVRTQVVVGVKLLKTI